MWWRVLILDSMNKKIRLIGNLIFLCGNLPSDRSDHTRGRWGPGLARKDVLLNKRGIRKNKKKPLNNREKKIEQEN